MTDEQPQNATSGAGAPGPGAPEVSERVSLILDSVEQEAARLREEAREEAARYLEYSKRRADGLVDERRRRIDEMSAELLNKADAVIKRLDDAQPVRQGFESLVAKLGSAAERLAGEAEQDAAEFEVPPFQGEPQNIAPPPPGQTPVAPPSEPTPPVVDPPGPGDVEPHVPEPPPEPIAPRSAEPEPEQEPEPQDTVPHPEPMRVDPVSSEESAAPGSGGSSVISGGTPPGAPRPEPAGAVPHGEQEQWRNLDDARLIAIQMAAAGNTRAQVRDHLQDALSISSPRGILDEIYGAGSADDARVPWTAFPR